MRISHLRMLICLTAAVSMLAFANWPLLLEVGRTMTKICRLIIGSGSLSKATNCCFWTGGTTNEAPGDLVAASVR